ncbi:MAG TPA: hypothetical protein DGG94_12460 [Micromonosporaceae bacterium]|nr:hypothetical protein [Micromonosporaceae bacterium]HCU50594.1 hypothetical protein [Micromonosporaceae bacterium]
MEQPSASDVRLARYLIRTHCPIDWPQGQRCLNCHNNFPCQSHQWGHGVLTLAGWPEDQISKLDVRTGPWS